MAERDIDDIAESPSMRLWRSAAHPAARALCRNMILMMGANDGGPDFTLLAYAAEICGPRDARLLWEMAFAPKGWSARRNNITSLMAQIGREASQPHHVAAWVLAQRMRADDGRRLVGACLSCGATGCIEHPGDRYTYAVATWFRTGPEAEDWRNVIRGSPHVMVRHFGGKVGDRIVVAEGSSELGDTFAKLCHERAMPV